jgi:prepilin-type N-terminal cleavage/methylation domain-containing protein
MPHCRRSAGFSLLELLIVISLMAILAGLVLPSSNPGIHDQLLSAARIMAADLAYGRGLAVANNSSYRFTFDTAGNRYLLEHSGTSAALDTLPDSPFSTPDDPPDEGNDSPGQWIVDLDELPSLGAPVRVVAVASVGRHLERIRDVSSYLETLEDFGEDLNKIDQLEFGPLGETTPNETTLIWLSAGATSARRYIVLQVDPVTGMATIGPYSGHGPPTRLLPDQPVTMSHSL